MIFNGQGRIRTLGGVTTAIFKTAALDHSATCPCIFFFKIRILQSSVDLFFLK